MRFDSLGAVKELDANLLKLLASHLNAVGYVTDEDEFLLGAALVEHWSEGCTDHLRFFGFDGSSLICIGQFFEGHGAIYLLYDPSKLSYEAARSKLVAAAQP
jgi:hypothetical protein